MSDNTQKMREDTSYYANMMEPWEISNCLINYNILVTHFEGQYLDKISNKVKAKVQVGLNDDSNANASLSWSIQGRW